MLNKTLVVLALAVSGPACAQDVDRQGPETRTKKGSSILFYGFARIDLAYSDSRMNDPQLAVRAAPEPDPTTLESNDDEFSLYGKLTRLGIDLDAGRVEALGGRVTGRVEVDFYGGGSDSRNMFRMRHAYLKIQWADWALLAGQTSDLISPRFPSVNDDMLMWNAGNLGDRRPQVRVRYDSPFQGGGGITIQFGIGLTGAVDVKDTVPATAVLNGENSGVPMVNARANVAIPIGEKRNLELAVWGHVAREEAEVGIKSDFDSHSVGVDFRVPIADSVAIHGEWWTGENLSDVRGGVGQGINAGTLAGIEADGGWVEIVFKVADALTLAVGQTMDDPKDSDVPAGGVTENRVTYATAAWSPGPVTLGLELHLWKTEYQAGTPDGDATRVKLWIAYKF